MKKFAQTAILVAGLVGLSACAGNNDVWVPQGVRTAGDATVADIQPAPRAAVSSATSGALASCQERARRLEGLNRSCYRK